MKGWKELIAFGRQSPLLLSDLRTVSRTGTGPVVVLLHGLYASAGVFRPLRHRLESELDASTLSFSYPPGQGVWQLVASLRRLLREAVEAQPSGPVWFVGHSLGALAVRAYLQSQPLPTQYQGCILLAPPFLGTPHHRLCPGQAGRDLSPDSALLRSLRSGEWLGEERLCPERGSDNEALRRRLLAFWPEDDALVEPQARADWGEYVLVPGASHNGILFDTSVHTRILRELGSSC